MNHRKKPILTLYEKEAVNDALLTWGILTRLELGESLGYSRQSILKQLMESGVKVSKGQTSVYWPPQAEQVDQLIGQLIKTRPKWGQALKAYYTATMKDDSVRTLAKAKGVSKSTYHEQIQKGREWIGLKLRNLH